MSISLFPFAPENLVARDGFDIPVPRQPAHLHTQVESGALSRDSSRFPRRRPFIYLKPPYAIGSVPNLQGHAIAYRWRSLPRVHRHRASKPQDSSSNRCCLGKSAWTNSCAPAYPLLEQQWTCSIHTVPFRHACASSLSVLLKIRLKYSTNYSPRRDRAPRK